MQASWPFNSNAVDATGNGNDGTVNGATFVPLDGIGAFTNGEQIAQPITLPGTDEARTYDLDGLGNWRKTVYTPQGESEETQRRDHNGLNEITRVIDDALGTPAKTPFIYDGQEGESNGNLQDDGIRVYEYDALNRQTRVWKTPSSPVLIGEYTYDAGKLKRDGSNIGWMGELSSDGRDELNGTRVNSKSDDV